MKNRPVSATPIDCDLTGALRLTVWGGGGPWPTLEGHPEHCPRTSQRARGREESGRAWLQDQARVTAEEARVQWELAPELERIQREAQHGEGGAWGEG